MSGVVIGELRMGDTSKTNPFTIAIIANPALERPKGSGTFVIDPIVARKPDFDACAAYVVECLYGTLPGQSEQLLAPPMIAPNVRIISVFVSGLPAIHANSLVAEDDVSNIAEPRRTLFEPFVNTYATGELVDVAYAVTASPTHTRASAWFTTDDDVRPGDPFTIDGLTMYHRHFQVVPGTVALPVTSTSLTALHEFQHALSSYTNGSIVDLYVDDGPGFNSKTGRPIPADFAYYNGTIYASDLIRCGLNYPPTWSSYHSDPHDPTNPVVMDNYWLGGSGATPNVCRNDKITQQFLQDRLIAKINRP
jgi:hypothetical protein